MKALPAAPPQLQLAIHQNRALMVIEPDARKEAVRALAEILLMAADAVEVHGPVELAEADHEAP